MKINKLLIIIILIISIISPLKAINKQKRIVTAYNVGDIKQTDYTPCIGAYNKVNLCKQIELGTQICAANFVPLGTRLVIYLNNGKFLKCIVWDRLAKKYRNRVDIAFAKNQKKEALEWGKKYLWIEILQIK